MKKIFDDKVTIKENETISWLTHKKDWISGQVVTAHGFVDVYAEPDKKFIQLRAPVNGKLRIRSMENVKRITILGLRRYAKQFIDEMRAKVSA